MWAKPLSLEQYVAGGAQIRSATLASALYSKIMLTKTQLSSLTIHEASAFQNFVTPRAWKLVNDLPLCCMGVSNDILLVSVHFPLPKLFPTGKIFDVLMFSIFLIGLIFASSWLKTASCFIFSSVRGWSGTKILRTLMQGIYSGQKSWYRIFSTAWRVAAESRLQRIDELIFPPTTTHADSIREVVFTCSGIGSTLWDVGRDHASFSVGACRRDANSFWLPLKLKHTQLHCCWQW